ncbi:LysR substrate-binding domain-containing protein [Oceanibium sediminis]|uniref:LysR substrate-binding domain-containing protein n=1 Tax=Oceanibium sediminis TaxID=2026339 RepID=UPI000DD348F2|nr:LysR substrate-binding domain-containing protein [Oceanibium sediminis]
MRLTHLNALRALEATLRLGSFAAAAKEIGITPAAVGQRIRTLEDYLGRPLFDRTALGAAPTAEAGEVVQTLGTGFAALADAMHSLKPDAAPEQIHVTMPESFAENWFAQVLSDFVGKHPGAELRVDASNRDHDLAHETFDFAIRYGKPLGAGFEERFLFGDSVQPVCSPGFAARHGLRADTAGLDGVPLIHVLNRTGDPGWAGFGGWARSVGIAPGGQATGVRFSKAGSGLQAAIAGQGLVMAGLVEAFHALKAGQLVMPFGADRRVETTYGYRLVHKRGARVSDMGDAFVTWLADRADIHRREVSALLQRFAG